MDYNPETLSVSIKLYMCVLLYVSEYEKTVSVTINGEEAMINFVHSRYDESMMTLFRHFCELLSFFMMIKRAASD